MTQPIDIPIDLNVSGGQQVSEAADQVDQLQEALNGVTIGAGGVQRAIERVTPSRASLVAWAGAGAAAGYYQQQLSGIDARAKITGQSQAQLSAGVRQLARDFPIGIAGAVQATSAVQNLGLSSQRQVPQIRALSREFVQLGAATGESIPELATNFGQLNRQLASLDPARVTRLGDVLTTVSAKTGASASGVVSFAQSIAPMAQQAGLGEAAVLGISGAFAKLGDSGYSAGTAVNKILTDINSSVREGSNQLTSYSQLVGMTSQQFRKLYEANPGEALSRVTNAIAASGPQGQYQLQNLGLDGVRTQRALLELSNSGGLGTSINQAVGAVGNGSTVKGANAAFGTLQDSLTKLRSSTGELAQSLGQPLLGPLTKITNMFGALTHPLVALAGSGPVQGVLTGAAYTAVGAYALRRLSAPGRVLGIAGMAAQAATSGPLKGIASGFTIGKYGEAEALAGAGGRVGSFGSGMTGLYMAGQPLGRGPMNYINSRAMDFGLSLGKTRAGLDPMPSFPRFGGGETPGRDMLRSLVRFPLVAGSLAMEGMTRFAVDQYHQVRTPTAERQTLLTPAAGGVFSRFGQSFMGGLRAQDVDGMTKSWRTLQTELGGTGAALRRFGGSLGTYAYETSRFAAAGVGRLGSMAAPVGKALGSFLGGPVGIGLGVGFLGYEAYKSSEARLPALDNRISNMDIYGTLDTYRDAMGKAGEASVTFADQLQMAASTVTRSVTSFGQAKHVGNQDVTAAKAGQQLHTYVGDASTHTGQAQIAAQIAALGTGGSLQPSDVQQAKYDLIKQGVPIQQVNQILSMVPNRTGKRLSSGLLSNLVGGVAAGAADAGSGGLWNAIKRSTFAPWENAPTPDTNPWNTYGKPGAGSPSIGAGASALNQITEAMGQQFAHQQSRGGAKYAASREFHTAQQVMADALKTRDADVVVATEQQLTSQLTGKAQGGYSPAEIQKIGLSGIIAASGGKALGYDLGQISGHVKPQIASPADFTALTSTGGTMDLLPFFTRQSSQPAGAHAVAASIASPENVSKQTTAINTLINSATKAGTSLTTLANQSTRALGQFGPNSSEYAIMQGVIAQVQFRQAGVEQQLTPTQSWAYQTRAALGLANTNVNDQNGNQLRAQGQSQLQSIQGQQISFMQARIMAQRQYDINSSRENEDFNRTMLRQDQDYNLQRLRATEDFQLQTSRATYDFQLQTRRSYQDYNLQLSREIQSAAQTMYDPYTRIQTKPVFDGSNLVGNLKEQNQALATQKANLMALRHAGISNQVIKTLDLTNTTNAQQVQEILNDISSDPTLINQLNAQVSKRLKGAKGLFTDRGNTTFDQQRQDLKISLSRSRQDFNTAQSRASQDFNTQMSRDAQDFNTQVSRETQDFHIQLARQAQDLHNQDLQITGNMKTLQSDMDRILHGQTVDWKNTLTSDLHDTLHEINKYSGKISNALVDSAKQTRQQLKASGLTSSGGTSAGGHMTLPSGTHITLPAKGNVTQSSFARALLQSIGVPTSASNMRFIEHWEAREGGNWNNNAHYNPLNTSLQEPGSVNYSTQRPGTGVQSYKDWGQGMLATVNTLEGGYYDGIVAALAKSDFIGAAQALINSPWDANHYGHMNPSQFAEGGIALRPHLGLVAEAGSPEAMIPLNQRGIKLLAAAMRSYMGDADAKFLAAGGRSHAVHIDSSTHHYDQRADFSGSQIEVVADDPVEFARKLEAKARLDNLSGLNPVRSN